jgi:hypothetical protein
MEDLKNRLKIRASIVKNYEKRNEKTNIFLYVFFSQ